MDKFKEYEMTEQYALEEEEREDIQQNTYVVKLPEYLHRMDELLKEGSEESRWELHDMFLDKETFHHYYNQDTVASMYVVMQIYEKEKIKGLTYTILDHKHTLNELVAYLTDLKFLLYRFDFCVGDSIEDELMAFIEKNQVSTFMMEIMLERLVMRPLSMAFRLAELYERRGKQVLLFGVLFFIEGHWPGNQEVLRKLCEIYNKTGHVQDAQICMEGILTVPLKFQYYQKEILELYEMLWRYRYRQKSIYEEFGGYIKKQRISIDVLNFVLEKFARQQGCYYLELADSVLNQNLEKEAFAILEFANRVEPGNETILCLLANMCIERNEMNNALAYLENVKEPGYLTERLRLICKDIIREGKLDPLERNMKL